ncbi:hypothetical protein [Jeongeupia sp. USM3]|uniref:hypothetical protein n=1 Tax=Jeongeupia sp. USM3 TaxID=1906741 RepID=UPI0011AB8354|nr:hypothetical protein [Jeongeupia sp. USM3]
MQPKVSMPLGKIVRSGDVCPCNGLWKPLIVKPKVEVIRRNTIMPARKGKVVFWSLHGYID